MTAIGRSLLIWLRNREGVARQDSTNTTRQLTNTTFAQTSERDTDKFSLQDITVSFEVVRISKSFKFKQCYLNDQSITFTITL